MKREEVIKNLKELLSSSYVDSFEDDENKALEIAIKALEQQPCKDAISREAVLDIINNPLNIRLDEIIKRLPSVRSQPKPARWIPIDEEPHEDYECSNCEYIISMYIDMAPHLEYKYCPNCGRKMEGTVYDCPIESNELPPVTSQPAIPLSWIEEQIKWLKSLDNAFSTLTAAQISAMVNKWKDEQNERFD